VKTFVRVAGLARAWPTTLSTTVRVAFQQSTIISESRSAR